MGARYGTETCVSAWRERLVCFNAAAAKSIWSLPELSGDVNDRKPAAPTLSLPRVVLLKIAILTSNRISAPEKARCRAGKGPRNLGRFAREAPLRLGRARPGRDGRAVRSGDAGAGLGGLCAGSAGAGGLAWWCAKASMILLAAKRIAATLAQKGGNHD
jgi:hypothetical protein